MFKQGIFNDESGVNHIFYEVMEKQFYRLDICKPGTPYQTNPEGVEYSTYRKRKTLRYGDYKVYESYKNLDTLITTVTGTSNIETSWSEGSFYETTTKTNTNLSFVSKTVKRNGIITEFDARYGNQYLSYNASNVGTVKLDPVNLRDYEEVSISKEHQDTYETPYYPLEILKLRYSIDHLFSHDWVVATTPEIAEKRLKEWYESDEPYKGFDTETTGLDVYMYGEDKLVGIILSIGEEVSTYFPFRMKGIPNLSKEFMDKLMKCCKEQEDRLVAHNKKFDRQVMMKEGYDLRIKWDTLIIQCLLDPSFNSHALKDLTYELTGLKFLELDEIFISAKDIDFSILDEELTRVYACPDSTNAVKVLKSQLTKIPNSMMLLVMVEMQLADLVADQEYYGMRVDVQRFKESYENCNYVLDMLLKAFRIMTSEDGNINSQEVLSELLYDKMGCEVLMYTTTGKRSTSGKVIDKLASLRTDKKRDITENMVDLFGNIVIKASTLANAKYPELVILQKYREYNKRKTAFYARFERTLNTGRIFFWVNQNGASSGRQSSPMHQLPPELKDVMLSDSGDYDLWGPDYSQVELRMIAYLAGEKELIEMCKDPTNDIHRVCASLITGKEMWEITKEERSIKKRVNFGVVYLISSYGLAGQLYGPGYTESQRLFADEQLNAFYERFKRIDWYIKQNRIKVEQRGKMYTDFGRVKYFTEIFSPDITRRKKMSIIRQANNMPVQGTAADLMKIAEVNMYTWIRNKGWNVIGDNGLPKVRVMLSIHDEVLISADRTTPKEEIIEMIAKCMQIEIKGAPPFFVSPAKMNNWGGHSDDSLAIPILYRDELIENYNKTGKSVFKHNIYQLEISDEVKSDIIKNNTHYKALCEKYLDDVKFVKLSGNYEEELTHSKKVEAFTAYIRSGFDKYVDDNYRELLNAYNDKVLHDYMGSIIKQYGPDARNVGMHVRHPSLTHELLARYSRELKGQDLDHIEQINYATKLYMSDNHDSVAETEEHEYTMDKDLFLDEISDIYNYDKDGNRIYDTEENDSDSYDISEDPDYVEYRTSEKIYKAWKVANSIVLDVQGLIVSDVDKVIAKAWEYRDTDGFFNVKLAMNNKLIDTKFKVEDLDLDDFSDYIVSLEG